MENLLDFAVFLATPVIYLLIFVAILLFLVKPLCRLLQVSNRLNALKAVAAARANREQAFSLDTKVVSAQDEEDLMLQEKFEPEKEELSFEAKISPQDRKPENIVFDPDRAKDKVKSWLEAG